MEYTDSEGKVHEVLPQYFAVPLSQNDDWEQQPPSVEPLPDVVAFFDVLKEKRTVFLARRNKYGDHLDKAKRFPAYIAAEIYTKCVRLIGMYERDEELDHDTLLDLSNYCDMLMSTRSDGSDA